MNQPLETVDLNLLRPLRVLLEERSVSRAARRLGLSQSATSHALARLRELFSDQLLVRVGNTMRPTPRALGLLTPIEEVLSRVERLVDPRERGAGEVDRTFRMLAADVAQIRLLPALVRRLANEAPKCRLVVHELAGADPTERLTAGEVDVAIFFSADLELPLTVERQPLFSERHVCVVREDLDVGERLDWKTYAGLGHIINSPRGTEYPLTRGLERAFSKRGLQRRRVLTVSGGMALSATLLHSDFVATITESEAKFLTRWFPLRQVEPPFRDTEMVESMLWDSRFGADPEHRWLRNLIQEVAAAET